MQKALVCLAGVDPLDASARTFGCVIDDMCYPFHTPKSLLEPCLQSSVPYAPAGEECTGEWVLAKGFQTCDCTGTHVPIQNNESKFQTYPCLHVIESSSSSTHC